MTRPWVIGWVTLVPLLLGAGPPVVKSAAPAPELDALFREPLIFKEGHILLPDRPGLGLELDETELKRLAA